MGSSILCSSPSHTHSGKSLQLFVTIADLRHSDNPAASLSTVALGSCLGVTCYDPRLKVGAMLHAMMPNSRKYPDATAHPARCVDTGVAALINQVLALGGTRSTLEVKVFGGAQILHANDYFSIGRQNVEMMRSVAAELQLPIKVWEVGGAVNRSIQLHLASGHVLVRMPNRVEVTR